MLCVDQLCFVSVRSHSWFGAVGSRAVRRPWRADELLHCSGGGNVHARSIEPVRAAV